MQLLEDLIKTHNDMSEYFRIPPLGQHYTQRWAKEELENERQKSAAAATSGPGAAAAPANNVAGATAENSEAAVKDEAGKMLKKAETTAAEEVPFGEMTQRYC